MKKLNELSLVWVLIAALVLFFNGQTTAQKLRKITFSKNDYEIKELVNSNGESITKITGKGMSISGKPGEPEIPVKLVKLIIASNEDVERIDYKILDKTERQLIAKIGSIATEAESEAEKAKLFYDKIYSTDEAWPKNAVKVVGNGYFDGNNHIVTLAVSPIQYYPKSNKIDAINEVEFTIKTKGSNKKIEIPIRKPEFQELYDNALAFLVDNKDEIPMYSIKSNPSEKEQTLKKTTTLTYGYPYVIITTSSLASSFDKFIKWKKRKGVNVGVFTVEDIYTAYPNGDAVSGINDNAGKIRQFLKDTYLQGTVFAFIGGTHETVPARYGTRVHNVWTSEAGETDDFKIPSDLYYSDFNGDWDVDGTDDVTDVHVDNQPLQAILVNTTLNPFGTSRYGEPATEYDSNGNVQWSGDNVEYLSEIFIGRLLCSTSTEILRWTNKLIRYEQNPGKGNTAYLTRSLMTQADELQDYNSNQGAADYCASYLPLTFSNSIIEEYPDGSSNSSTPTGNSIISEVNDEKYGLWSWFNHGSPVNIEVCRNGYPRDGILSGRYEITGFDSLTYCTSEPGNGLNNLTNEDYPSIVYAVSCRVAPFDKYDPHSWYGSNMKNLAQCFTTENIGGGPAFLGNSRNGNEGFSIPIYVNFLQAINSGHFQLGELESLARINDSAYHAGNITHNLIGCPETSLWTAAPSYFTNVTITDNGSSVTVSTGVSSSIIAAFGVNSTPGYLSRIVGTTATFNTSIRPLYITITKQNYIPYTAITGGTFGQTLTIDAGETLYIQAGANLSFPSGTGIIVNGKLNAVGSSSNNITFTRSGSSGTWNGIQFNVGSSGSIQYSTVQYATNGIYAYNSPTSLSVTNSTLQYNGKGIFCDYYSTPVLHHNLIQNNSYGVYCSNYRSPSFAPSSTSGNVIRNNTTNGIYAQYNSSPSFGGTNLGWNSIYGNTSYAVSAYYGCNINAVNNWWNTTTPAVNTNYSTVTVSPVLTYNPNYNVQVNNENSLNDTKTSLNKVLVNDGLELANEKQKDKKYDEAISLFLEVFKFNKDVLLGRYALCKIEECFTQAGKKDYLDFSRKEIKPLLKEGSESYVVALELEAHQMVNAGLYQDAINNLQTILKKHNLNSEIDKHTLFTLGAFNSLYCGDKANSDKYFGELIKKYPKDELVNQIEIIKSLGIVSGNDSKNDGAFLPYSEAVSDSAVTEELFSNYPNPFNPSTKITFTIKEKGKVGLKIYDILGKEVANLIDGVHEAGKHTATFDGSNLASGIYFYRLTTPSATITKKMMLVK